MTEQKKLTVALISGGISSEREVSLRGGDQMFAAMDKNKYQVLRYDPKFDLGKIFADAARIDVALINLHGNFGEDGTVQGLLDLLGIPYQGSGVVGSAIAMNKLASKRLYEQAGLPIPPYRIVQKNHAFDPHELGAALGLPLVVKPAQGGSSVGVSIVRSIDAVEKAIETAFAHDDVLVIESYIDGIEITGGILGNDHLESLPLIEIIPTGTHDFFDYEAKYSAGVTREICPARIDEELTRTAQAYAKAAHSALFCKGCSRTDMILKDRSLYILETNTIPGMTETSLLPLAAKTAGISFSQLIDKLIELGLAADRSKVT